MATPEWRVPELLVGSDLGDEEIQVITDIIKSRNTLAYGPYINQFQEDFSQFCGGTHAFAVSSATGALEIAASLARVGPGDEVLITAQTFRASVVPFYKRWCKFKFADIDPNTLNIDPDSLAEQISDQTKAVVLVHHAGTPCDMDPILEIAHAHGAMVIEDAAHAVGASYKGRKIGSFGDVACFSFQSLKNMTTLGEGGMITTPNPELAQWIPALRSYGTCGTFKPRSPERIGPIDRPAYGEGRVTWERDVVEAWDYGLHFRITEPQAGVGSVQLKKLPGFNARRTEIAQRYNEGIKQIEGMRICEIPEWAETTYHLYHCFIDTDAVRVDHAEFVRTLEQDYRVQIVNRFFPVHLTEDMRYYGHEYGEAPVCEDIWFNQQIDLPINPMMPMEEVDYAIESLAQAMKKCRQ